MPPMEGVFSRTRETFQPGVVHVGWPMEGVLSRTRETSGGSIPSGGKCISRAGGGAASGCRSAFGGKANQKQGGTGNGRSIEFWRNAEVGEVADAILLV